MSPWLDFRMPERRIWAMQTQKVGLRHNSNVLAHDWLPSFLRENQFKLLLCVGLALMKSHLLLAIEVITANYACRIEYPALAHRAFTLAMETCSRWKIPAAKAASMGAPWAPGRGANTSQK